MWRILGSSGLATVSLLFTLSGGIAAPGWAAVPVVSGIWCFLLLNSSQACFNRAPSKRNPDVTRVTWSYKSSATIWRGMTPERAIGPRARTRWANRALRADRRAGRAETDNVNIDPEMGERS